MNKIILGIDEVGRGPYAGPLVVGACILKDQTMKYPSPISDDSWLDELTDSKKITSKKREQLYSIILEKSVATATGWVSAMEIDKIGLSEALKLATRRAVEKIQKSKTCFTEIIIDGTQNFLIDTNLAKYVITLKKADFLIKEVSAASIIAKVERDRYMRKLAKKYPEYGFEQHVGYGTKQHQKALEEFGPIDEHRKSFSPVAKILQDKNRVKINKSPMMKADKHHQTTKEIGDFAENKIALELEKNGHEIIARNHHTKYYEIDIISKKQQEIFFTEVKYRKNAQYGKANEMIDAKKLKQIKFAASNFLDLHKEFSKYTPILLAGFVENEKIEILRIEDFECT